MSMFKICPKCGRKLKVGETCPCILAKRQEHFDQVRKKWRQNYYRNRIRTEESQYLHSFYGSQKWKDLRDYVMNLYGNVDLYALAVHHEIIPADVVHHIKTIREDWDDRLDSMNLIPVSYQSHDEIHTIYDSSDNAKKELQEKLFRILRDNPISPRA